MQPPYPGNTQPYPQIAKRPQWVVWLFVGLGTMLVVCMGCCALSVMANALASRQAHVSTTTTDTGQNEIWLGHYYIKNSQDDFVIPPEAQATEFHFSDSFCYVIHLAQPLGTTEGVTAFLLDTGEVSQTHTWTATVKTYQLVGSWSLLGAAIGPKDRTGNYILEVRAGGKVIAHTGFHFID